MKRYLLILALSVLLLAGMNLRENSVIVTSADFPTSEQVYLGQHDDSHRAEIARQANSLFAPPSTRTIASGENHHTGTHLQRFATITFTSQVSPLAALRPTPCDNLFRIAGSGSFGRATDYYVFALHRIVI
jgi:hypothetical protein